VALTQQLQQCKGLREGMESYLYADSGSNAKKYMEVISAQVDCFSDSHKKRDEGLERGAVDLQAMQ
jgi:hypothetical protein